VKPLAKAILFTRVVHDRKTHQWPTAVFGNAEQAKQYAVFLHIAHVNGDAVMARKLDAKTILNEDGTLAKGAKFAVQTVAYNPVPDTGVSEDFEMEESAAS
jgi:hypothetical protein